MLLTLTTTYSPATDLGYLLHKNPANVQDFDFAFGHAHVFYPEATEERCTAALLVDIDPVGLVRANRRNFALDQYVNDRPYVASSFLSVTIAEVFRNAMNGQSKERPDLASTPIPLIATLYALPCRGGEALLRRLFEPLGYHIEAERYPLDSHFPEWGDSSLYTVTIGATCKLADLLVHLYVLIPVLDDEKHYWVGDDEVEKLARRGEGWLAGHPEKNLIARRYLRYQKRLVRDVLAQLIDSDQGDPDAAEEHHTAEEVDMEKPLSLNDQRIGAVVAAIKASGARRVLDLGCAEGQLIRALMKDSTYTEIVGLDVSYRMLEVASDKMRYHELSERQRERIKLLHGSLMYRDDRLVGYDAAAVVEVIEHLDPPRLTAFERVLFEFARPSSVVVTTPNVEYNVQFTTLPAGKFRHRDHRFEWTRAEFGAWANRVAARFGYTVRFVPIGPDAPSVGSPTQMAIFTRMA
jgi:3' terminal RNA ribose 2'-O-methyltransferase Hen1